MATTTKITCQESLSIEDILRLVISTNGTTPAIRIVQV